MLHFPYDGQLAALVANDTSSIDAVVEKLQSIDSLLDDLHDGLAWFNRLYLQVTLAVRANAGEEEFVTTLDFHFANLYFQALRSWLAGNESATPESWQILFAQRANLQLARIQFALAGVNAHINRDLAVAVVATCQSMGFAPQHDAPPYRQYTELNSTLDSLIEQAKRELMVRLPGDALPQVDQVEQVVASWSVAAARESAWVHAEILNAVSFDSALATRFADALDGTATLAGKALLIAI